MNEPFAARAHSKISIHLAAASREQIDSPSAAELIANIEPGKQIDVTIKYFSTPLRWRG